MAPYPLRIKSWPTLKFRALYGFQGLWIKQRCVFGVDLQPETSSQEAGVMTTNSLTLERKKKKKKRKKHRMIAKSHWHYKTVHMSSCHPEDSVSGTSRPLLINAQPRWSPDIFFAKVTKHLGVCTACLCWVRATLPSTDVSPIILFILRDGHTGCHLATGSPTGTILQACHLIQCDSLPLKGLKGIRLLKWTDWVMRLRVGIRVSLWGEVC